MELTGECREAFRDYWCDNQKLHSFMYATDFHKAPESMQYGVYVDFFDSVHMDIESQKSQYTIWHLLGKCSDIVRGGRVQTRQKAIEKSNEIYNSQNK